MFKGLPGLIVKISDEITLMMELKGSTKFASPTEENMESAVTQKMGQTKLYRRWFRK
jgi:hypothetical protein